MRTNFDNVPIETLVQELISEVEDVNRLNLFKQNQRTAFLEAIKKRPKLLQNVKGLNAEHFLTVAINANYKNFTYLKREQYSDKLAQIFLYKRLENQDITDKNEKLIIQKSFDDRIIFNYMYSTIEGDELYYFDKELGVPASLKSGLKVSIKVVDAVALIEKLDTHITQLGANKICSTLTDIITSRYKACLNDYIAMNDVGYYTLCASSSILEGEIKEKMSEVFKEYGIIVSELTIQKLAIPKDIQYKLEDQAFQIRKKRADIEADAEFAEISLKNYEEKLAIEEKYPNAQHTLTEYEKDLALQRFLIKNGIQREQDIDHSIKLSQKEDKKDAAIAQKADVIPEVPQKKNVFKIVYFVFLALFLTISFILMGAVGIGAGFIMLGITIIVFGLIAAFMHEKFKKQKVEVITGGNK